MFTCNHNYFLRYQILSICWGAAMFPICVHRDTTISMWSATFQLPIPVHSIQNLQSLKRYLWGRPEGYKINPWFMSQGILDQGQEYSFWIGTGWPAPHFIPLWKNGNQVMHKLKNMFIFFSGSQTFHWLLPWLFPIRNLSTHPPAHPSIHTYRRFLPKIPHLPWMVSSAPSGNDNSQFRNYWSILIYWCFKTAL